MAAKSSSAIREGDLTGDEAKKEMARRATAITPTSDLHGDAAIAVTAERRASAHNPPVGARSAEVGKPARVR
jgi:hypothetical protein